MSSSEMSAMSQMPETENDRPQPGRDTALGFRPLYRQVKDVFMKRLLDGVWQPGAALASEIQLAAELGVSQGTVRKALDEMASENLIVRRQGRGTFVAEHTEARILFQFFKLVADTGQKAFPDSHAQAVRREKADALTAERLDLAAGDEVIVIERTRALGGAPVVSETIRLNAATFGGLDAGPVPNNLYAVYASKFGVTVARATEKLKAVGLDAHHAGVLGRPVGTPALLIDRSAFALDGSPVEWRVSVCLTDDAHYLSELK